MNIFFNLLYIHYDCTVNSTIWNKKYLPIHYNVAWYIFSTMVALKPRGLTWQDHTPTHTFPVSTEMFFLMAIICLNIWISTICNWVFLGNSACQVCRWHLYLFVWFISFSLLHISCWASCWQHCWRTRPGRRRCGGLRWEPSAAWSRSWKSVSRWLPCWWTGGSTEHSALCANDIFG